MPSARPSAFRGASGILRDVDATIVGLQFTDLNPLSSEESLANRKSDFHTLFGVLQVQVDGAETSSPQPLFVGSADDFGITADEMGLTGDGALSKSSGWFTFLDSLVRAGFDESNFPEDPAGKVADFSALVGARVRLNWQVNEKATKKYGKKKSKQKDAKTGKFKEYDREDLIVTNYYGQVAVTPQTPTGRPTTSASPRPTSQAKPLGSAKGGTSPVVNIGDLAEEHIVTALKAAKGKTLTKSKLSVKLLTALQTSDPALRDEVRTWAVDDDNLSKIDGVTYDRATTTLTLDAD